MVCAMCEERGKTWEGGDPECAFRGGYFTHGNWNCATMNALREYGLETAQRDVETPKHCWNEDQNCLVIPVDDHLGLSCNFIVLGWYKSRGKTEQAREMTDHEMRPLRLSTAMALLR
jgi:hypothetical protein